MKSKVGQSVGIFNVALVLPLATIIVFYFLSIRFSIDIPWFDDIENIPYFLLNFLNAETWLDKWETIIRPNNEHRVLAARLIVLVQYAMTGALNFRVLSFCGNLSVLGIFLFIARGYLKRGGHWLYLIPVVFFIFNLQSYAGTFMTIMSMQYQMVIFLSVVSCYFLSKRDSAAWFAIAIVVAYVDTFSMGNGMMVWPSGLVMLAYQARWRSLFVWLLFAGMAIFLYFHGYDFVQGNDSAFSYILKYPIRTTIAFFTMMGGDLDIFASMPFNKRMMIPTFAGLVIAAIFGYWLMGIFANSPFWGGWLKLKIFARARTFSTTKDKDDRWNAFWLGAAVYVIISMLLVTVFRTRFDPHIILWSTYKMYPAVLTAIVYLIFIEHFGEHFRVPVFWIMVIASGLAWVSTLVNYIPIVKQTRRDRTAFAFNQRTNGVGLGATKNSAFEKMLAETLAGVASRGIYKIPDPLIHPDERLLVSATASGEEEKVTITQPNDDIMDVELAGILGRNEKKYVLMRSAANTYLFAINATTRHAICPKGTIYAGDYDIAIWVVSEAGNHLSPTGQKVRIQ